MKAPAPLKHLQPGWYAIVMGLAGLSLAWFRAEPLMGPTAAVFAAALAGLAAAVFVALLAATLLRWRRHPQAWAEDRRHPVRHTFVATLPVSVMLLGTVAAVGLGPTPLARVLWWAGSIAQLGVTWWVLSRWWRPKEAGGLAWPMVTPALFIPIVGNVLAPLGGVPLGHEAWAIAQFGIGLAFWPVVQVLLVVRLLVAGPWPERLRPANVIFVAPPAVVGLSVLQLGAPSWAGWLLWGIAGFTLLWVGTLAPTIAKQPFGLPHWGASFPLAAFAALCLRLALPGSAMAVLAPIALALASIVVVALLLGTWRGLRDGSLLSPEPVATIAPAAG